MTATGLEHPNDTARRALAAARLHLSPGLALGQKLTGGGAIEAAAEGAVVHLSDGRSVVDFGSYALTLLGHRPEAVVRAVERQLATLPTSTKVLANAQSTALAARLAGLIDPGRLERIWLGQNGADAVEVALKLARLATGRTRVVALEGAFHGKTLGALAATWNPRFRRGLERLLGGVTHVPWDAAAVEQELATGDVAAVIFEPVQGEGGVMPVPEQFLRQLAAAARAAGVFVISDEVQVGLYRAGPASVAVDMGLGVDAVLLGKHLGGGLLPLSAALCSEELFVPLRQDPFVHTTAFSGHPLAAAAGLATLDELERVAGRVPELGAELATRLGALAAAHPSSVREVRGRGLIWGIELHSLDLSGEVLTELCREGLLVSPCLGRPDVIRLLPPVVVTAAQLDRAFAALDAACTTAEARVGMSPVDLSAVGEAVR